MINYSVFVIVIRQLQCLLKGYANTIFMVILIEKPISPLITLYHLYISKIYFIYNDIQRQFSLNLLVQIGESDLF